MDSAVICLDVGGTSIKSGVVDSALDLVGGAIAAHPAMSDRDAGTIVANLAAVILGEAGRLRELGASVLGIGFGFPGPFDYPRGRSLMRGLEKYDSIHGLDLPALLRSSLGRDPAMAGALAAGCPILFENDATLFALGEFRKGGAAGRDRALCLTLGTGCGSTFLDRGRVVRGEEGVPESGAIYREPFGEGIIDDYLSRRGILNLARMRGFDVEANDVRELAALAREGNPLALGVFDEFGSMLGRGITPFVEKFRPEVLVFGGRISGAFELFGTGLRSVLGDLAPEIRVSEDTSRSALIGAAHLVFGHRESGRPVV
jgi:glucokinase